MLCLPCPALHAVPHLPPTCPALTCPAFPCPALQLGTMWGIFPKEEAQHIIPEGHRRPHFDNAAASSAASSATAAAGGAGDGELSFGDTPEDHPDGRVAPMAQASGQQGMDAAAAAGAAGKGEAQPALRMRRFGSARQEA